MRCLKNKNKHKVAVDNCTQVLIDWEIVRTALKLPADCGDEARLRLMVQLANSSLAEQQLSQQRQQLQQQLSKQQEQLSDLATQLEGFWIGQERGSSSSDDNGASSNRDTGSFNSSAVAQELLRTQAAVDDLQDLLHSKQYVAVQLVQPCLAFLLLPGMSSITCILVCRLTSMLLKLACLVKKASCLIMLSNTSDNLGCFQRRYTDSNLMLLPEKVYKQQPEYQHAMLRSQRAMYGLSQGSGQVQK